jgi:diguanylate cyclase (GGDEF)-like protein
MMNYLNKLDILLDELRQHHNLEENLSRIVRTIKSDLDFQSLAIYTKVEHNDIFRIKISRNISHTYEKSSVYNTEDPLIKQLKKLDTIVVGSKKEYKFEKDFTQLLIIPLHNNHELLGFLFIDRINDSFNDLEFTLLEIYSSILSLGISLHKQRYQIEKMRQTEEITGMYNYETFCQKADYVFRLMQKTESPLTAVVFKVDDYELILKTYGLNTIRQTAAKLADILRNMLEETDMFGKIYNDTVAILLPTKKLETVTTQIEEINKEFQKLTTLQKVKIGWGIVSAKCINIEQLIRTAEQAAFESTRKRHNNITVVK